jgi:hypothetical protein
MFFVHFPDQFQTHLTMEQFGDGVADTLAFEDEFQEVDLSVEDLPIS